MEIIMSKGTKRMVMLALLISQALVLSVIESMIPFPAPVPGIKLGLANVITITAIAFFGMKDALIVVFCRTFLASLFTGGMFMFMFSLSGGILSAIVMGILYKRSSDNLSITGISIAGSIAHNIGQLVIAAITMKTFDIFLYSPVLMISALITGFCIGISAFYLIRLLRKHLKTC
jgi:heptaprenyl diphosphate synthase